jgi:hypothetical protein
MAVATSRSVEGVQRGIRDIATRWSRERAEREQRRELAYDRLFEHSWTS